jgi:glycosyltransferase involved in cell wall biosynthesis
MQPTFSILIPTRDRPATLRSTLMSVVTQIGNDFEVVIADNCSGPATSLLVDEFQKKYPFIRYICTEEVLPMAENWELGLKACQGAYITVLGDDDGFLPYTLVAIRKLIAMSGASVIAWEPHTYWWPDTIVYWNSNRIVIHLENSVIQVNSDSLLNQFFLGACSFSSLPMIYNSFVAKTVIDQCRERWGRYFVPHNLAPDVTSGIANLVVTESFVYSYRGLSIRGNSGKSNGTAQWARSLGAKQREIYFAEEKKTLAETMHPSLIASPNLNMIIANCKLYCRDFFFKGNESIKDIDLRSVVDAIIAQLNNEPAAYYENLADAKALADKIGYKLDLSNLPEVAIESRRKFSGAMSGQGLAAKVTSSVVVDGDMAGVFDIYAAGRLIESMLPPLDDFPGA